MDRGLTSESKQHGRKGRVKDFQRVVFFLALAGLGLLSGLFVLGDPPPSTAPVPVPAVETPSRVVDMEMLERSAEASEGLENPSLKASESPLPAGRLRPRRPRKDGVVVAPRKRKQTQSMRRPVWEQSFDDRVLTQAGYSAQEVQRLRSEYEGARDRVMRRLGVGPYGDGVGLSPGEAREVQSLAEQALKSEVGDLSDFDAMLYATGQANRVEVQQPTSLGHSLGLKKGDLLVSYGGTPEQGGTQIFTSSDYLALMQVDRDRGASPTLVFFRPGVGSFSVAVPRGIFGAPIRGVQTAVYPEAPQGSEP